jgi:hypothetical protein
MLCLLLASGCDRLLTPAQHAAAEAASGPSRELTERAVNALLPGLRFGADEASQTYREIRALRVAGAHFLPASNRYIVHYCVDYTSFASEALQTRCDLNVHVYQLDSQDWVGFATGTGTIYRWQVLETSAPAEAQQAAAPEAAPAPKEAREPPASESAPRP